VDNTRSSLAHLRQLPVEMIKLDQGLVSALAEDQSSAAAISQIIDLGHSLGRVVVAKGVETADQASALVILGCDLAQGHYLAQPLPAERMTVLLKPAPRTHPAAVSRH
jgi:EAL domain-containing protein (putative c-di-GMP-specific phosphodiesterase class I)